MKVDWSYNDIHKHFKKSDHTHIDDLEKYIFDISGSHKAQLAGESFKISVGTDSLFAPKKTHWSATYMSAVAFTYGNMGTHLIFRRDVINGPWNSRLDLFTRLWREVQMTGDLAMWIKETCNISPDVHLDINPNTRYKSNALFNSAKGYIESLGFKVELKPDASIASCAADHFLGI